VGRRRRHRGRPPALTAPSLGARSRAEDRGVSRRLRGRIEGSSAMPDLPGRADLERCGGDRTRAPTRVRHRAAEPVGRPARMSRGDAAGSTRPQGISSRRW
jgi:hypothetical protein